MSSHGHALRSTEEILLRAGKFECCSLCQTRDSSLWQCLSHIHLAASMAQEEGTCQILFQPFPSLLLSNRWVISGRGYHPFPVGHPWRTTGRPTDMPFVLWNWLEASLTSLRQKTCCYWKHWGLVSFLTSVLIAPWPGSSLQLITCIGCWVPPGGMLT